MDRDGACARNRYYFLDEPTTYLDMAHQLEVLELLQRLNREQQRTIVMVLHDLNQAARFADYMIAMKDGKIVQAGTCEQVMTPDVLRKVFHIDAEIGRDPRTNKPMCITYHLIKGDAEYVEKRMMSILLLFVLILSACGNQATEKEQEKATKETNEPKR